jgi:small subunit ribosomal protein S19
MGRSLKKGPYVDEKLYGKVERQRQQGRREPIKTWARACTIVPEFVGQTFQVHNGHKLGEFALTRTFRGHTNKKEGIKSGR